ncbi:carbohydrate kinase family protein [Luedemannella helvata]|uniref:Sugar kinase n=1 Tax=Luedemannella helvata TaxID=349315 RepID=A0ABP4X5E9_9ACTN
MTGARHGRVLVVGDIVTDVLAAHPAPLAPGADTRARIRVTGGGSAANTAAWLAAHGVPVALVGVAGGDAAGEERLVELGRAGVDHAAVRRAADAATGCVVVLVRGDERTMLSDRGANALLRPDDVDGPVRAPEVAHVHVSAYVLLDPATRPAGRHALATARALGRTTSVGAASAVALRAVPDFVDLVRGIDLLLCNADEARALLRLPAAGPAATPGTDLGTLAVAVAAHVGHAVVTGGPAGAAWARGGAVIAQAGGLAVDVVDATGAGDAFASGVLQGFVSGADPRAALRTGTERGAAAVTRLGARP